MPARSSAERGAGATDVSLTPDVSRRESETLTGYLQACSRVQRRGCARPWARGLREVNDSTRTLPAVHGTVHYLRRSTLLTLTSKTPAASRARARTRARAPTPRNGKFPQRGSEPRQVSWAAARTGSGLRVCVSWTRKAPGRGDGPNAKWQGADHPSLQVSGGLGYTLASPPESDLRRVMRDKRTSR